MPREIPMQSWTLRSGAESKLDLNLEEPLAIDGEEDHSEGGIDEIASLWSQGLGVDFGASTIRAVAWSGSQITPLPSVALPSFVGFTNAGKVLLGHEAKSAAAQNPGNVFSVGALLQSLEEDRLAASWQWASAPPAAKDVSIRGRPCTFLVVELLGFLLWRIRELAQEQVTGCLESLVLSVPAWCNLAQRRILEEVAQLGGFRRVRLLRSPMGAALWRYLPSSGRPTLDRAAGASSELQARDSHERQILLVDLGAASLNCALVVVEDGVFEARWAGGLLCGGADIDKALGSLCIEKSGQDCRAVDTNEEGWTRLLTACEKAKRALCTSQSVRVHVPRFFLFPTGAAKDLDVTIFQSDLVQPLSKIVSQIRVCLQSLFTSNDHQHTMLPDVADIDEVVLLGGSTKLTCLHTMLQDLICNGLGLRVRKFSCGPEKGTAANAAHANACGAALQGAILGERKSEGGPLQGLMLLDTCSYAVGVCTYQADLNKYEIQPDVFAHAPFPTVKEICVQVVGPHEPGAQVHIMEQTPKCGSVSDRLGVSGGRELEWYFVGSVPLSTRLPNNDDERFRIRLEVDAAGRLRAGSDVRVRNGDGWTSATMNIDPLAVRNDILSREQLARLSALVRLHAAERWVNYSLDGLEPRVGRGMKIARAVTARRVTDESDDEEEDDKTSEATDTVSPTSAPHARGAGDARGHAYAQKLQEKLRQKRQNQPRPSVKQQGDAQADASMGKTAAEHLSTTEVCTICLCSEAELGKPFQFVLEKCGHKCICKPCLRKMKAKKKRVEVECPLCRQHSKPVLRGKYDGDIYAAEADL